VTPNQTFIALGVVLSFVWAVAFWLLKDKTSKVLAAVDRIPEKDWFERVNVAMGRIPSEEFLERLVKHLDRVNEIGERVALVEASSKALWARDEKDHERLGRLEAQMSFLSQRLELSERRP
jgi:hypothetical protein